MPFLLRQLSAQFVRDMCTDDSFEIFLGLKAQIARALGLKSRRPRSRRDLGFEAEKDFEAIIRAHIADELGGKLSQ